MLSYTDVLRHNVPVGERVAVVGAGGIGFDVSEFLTHDHDVPAPSLDVATFMKEWGVDMTNSVPGGLVTAEDAPPAREVFLLQRKKGKLGAGLGKTTGWIHRAALKKKNVNMIDNVKYVKVDDEGLHITRGGKASVLPVDHIVVCAGQEPLRPLLEPLRASKVKTFTIGGAEKAGELDAKRAIDQGTRLAANLENAKDGEVFDQPVSFEAGLVATARKWTGRSYA